MERDWLSADPGAMAQDSDEAQIKRDAFLAFQRDVMAYLPEWIRFRGLKQKHIANGLGVSESTVSRYIRGQTTMSVGTLQKIAFLLQCHVGDLVRPPPEQGLGQLVEDTLAEMDRIGPDRWRKILDAAKDVRGKNEG